MCTGDRKYSVWPRVAEKFCLGNIPATTTVDLGIVHAAGSQWRPAILQVVGQWRASAFTFHLTPYRGVKIT